METIKIDGVDYTENEIKALSKAGVLNIGRKEITFKNDPASLSLSGTPTLQGPFPGSSTQFGIFSAPGVRPQCYSAMARPRTLARLLTPERTDYYQEIIEIMTGATAGSGANATGFCGNPPQPGQLKTCQQTYLFGQYYIKTTLNSIPEIGQLRNRADIPGEILNAGPTANPLIPTDFYRLTDTRSQLSYNLFMVGVELERGLEKVSIVGNQALASTSTQLGFIKEFNGLDSLIKTGTVDAVSLQPCKAADSDVINFNTSIGGTDSKGRTITTAVSDLYYALQDRSVQVGMENIEYAWVMRKELFRVLTDTYANTYATTRFTLGSAANPLMQDATATNNLRLQMLQGQFLMVEGMEIPVVFSDGVTLVPQGGNTFMSDMYLVPLSWMGRRLLRLEYFPMDNQYQDEFANYTGGDLYRVINNGMFRVGKRSTGQCDEYHFAAQMRMILEAPFLAGRIDNVIFNYYADTRDPYPGSTYFYVNGGPTYRS